MKNYIFIRNNNKCEMIEEEEDEMNLLQVVVYRCVHCNRSFNDRSNKCKHEKVCKLAGIPIDMLEIKIREIIKHELKRMLAIYYYQPKKEDQNIKINPFGKERIDHITTDHLSECLKNLPKNKGILKLLELIYFNEEVQDNMNVRLLNKRDKQMIVYTECNKSYYWKVIDSNDCIRNMIDKARNMLQKYFVTIMDDIPDTELTIYIDNLQDLSENTTYSKRRFYDLRRSIYALLCANVYNSLSNVSIDNCQLMNQKH